MPIVPLISESLFQVVASASSLFSAIFISTGIAMHLLMSMKSISYSMGGLNGRCSKQTIQTACKTNMVCHNWWNGLRSVARGLILTELSLSTQNNCGTLSSPYVN